MRPAAILALCAVTGAACATVAPGNAVTSGAVEATATSATLRGYVLPRFGGRVSFEYSAGDGATRSVAATPASVASAAMPTPVSATVTGLACATTHVFRVRLDGSRGSVHGQPVSFTTADCPPLPPSGAASCASPRVHCVAAGSGPTQEFATIQAAADVANPGDAILVFDGTYTGFVLSRSGTASAPITVRANGTGAVIDRVNSANEGIRVSNASHVVIEGFIVSGMPAFGLTARGATGSAPMRNVVFRHNTVRDSGSVNIYASQVAGSLIEGNVALGSRASHGIYLANGGADDTTIRGNLIHGNGANGIHVNGDASVSGDGIVSRAVIEDNIVHSNAANGINLDGLQASTLRNNLVYGNGRHAVRAYRIDAAAGPRGLVIANNTLVVAGGGNTPVKLSEDLGGHVIFNNVLVNEGSGGTLIVGHATLASDHNTFVNPGFSLDGAEATLTLEQWRARAHDTASRTSTHPQLFVAGPARDYRLRAGSPAVDAGVASFAGQAAPGEDIAGTSRPRGAAHDHGAYESF